MKPRTLLAIATVPLSVGLVLGTGPTFAGTSPITGKTSKSTGRTTSFAFKGSGFGTRVIGGQAPAASDTTAYQAIGCTNRAGRQRRTTSPSPPCRESARSPVPGPGSGRRRRTASSPRTRRTPSPRSCSPRPAWASWRSTGITSTSTASTTQGLPLRHLHAGREPRLHTSGRAGTVLPAADAGPAGHHPRPGHRSTRAGARPRTPATELGPRPSRSASTSSPSARRSGSRTPRRAELRRHRRRLRRSSAATHVVTAAGGIVKGGRDPLNLMPCQGTYGKVRQKRLSTLDLGGQLVTSNVSTRAEGRAGRPPGPRVRARHIGRLSLGGQLLITDIVAKATVTRTAHGVVKSAKGTRLGTITANGQEQTFPKTGVLEIPGVVKLERAVVTRTHDGDLRDRSADHPAGRLRSRGEPGRGQAPDRARDG